MIGALVISLALLLGLASAISNHPLVLLLAIDGFGWDYLDRGLTPHIQHLKDSGSSAQYMYNEFPTVTHPNFFSIATGLHPETHGVIGNRAFNAEGKCLWNNETGYELFHYNEKVTPLWTLNELSGKERYSATSGWPSSQYDYRNHTIVYSDMNKERNSTDRIDQVIRWLLDDTKPANLVFLYFGMLDAAGHYYGPNSEQVNQTLQEVDNFVDYLLQSLSKNGIRDKLNLILLSDHGMLDLPPKNLIDYHKWLKNESFDDCGESPSWQIKFKPGFEAEVYENLTKAAANSSHFDVYRRDEIPERWHVKHTNRQADLLLVAYPGYGFTDASEFLGDHGYDPDKDIRVRPIFIANGPAFKSNYTIDPFSNLDIFPLVSTILKLDEPPIKPNGTITFVKDILKN